MTGIWKNWTTESGEKSISFCAVKFGVLLAVVMVTCVLEMFPDGGVCVQAAEDAEPTAVSSGGKAQSSETNFSVKLAESSENEGSENEETILNETISEEITLRVCSWEEYIDLGDWAEEETIDLESGDILGEQSMVEDFEDWYEETYGIRVNVEYSTFGTNEDLYNMLTLGDVYDLVCPSEYMIMKLMAEEQLQPLSEEFFNLDGEYNYYIQGVSPFIRKMFEEHEIQGETWSKYAAGYMWGVTGIVYNPEQVSREDASTWTILNNSAYRRQVTIKDNVRDSYFAAVGALKSELLTSDSFLSDPNYTSRLEEEMNDISPETIQAVQEYLQDVKDNVYSFETDSGKADMITGKVLANYQWSGDAVYTMDQADEDDYQLNFAVPEECTNIYFDGWVMLKKGIQNDTAKQHAAEAFINFVSRPDNAIRNMYYIGYTSVISGGEDGRIFEYANWNFGAEEGEEDTAEYDLSYFFDENEKAGTYVITTPTEQLSRQLFAQYPDEETISRSSIMVYFDESQYEDIYRMWISVRCYNLYDVPVWAWCLAAVILLGGGAMLFHYRWRNRSIVRRRAA